MTRRRPDHTDEHSIPPEDTTYVFSRAEDRSLWWRLSVFLDKYKPLVWALVLIATAAGFGFKTPMQTFSGIHKRLEKLEARDSVAQLDQKRVERKLDALINLGCFELSEKHLLAQAQLAGLTCGPQPELRP